MGTAPAETPIRDEHSVLLWQACAYAEDLREAIGTGHGVADTRDAMLEFLHYRLLPYLAYEERELPPARLRDGQLRRLLLADHARLRADVGNIESSRTPRVLSIAVEALLDRLDRHLLREESWLRKPMGERVQSEPRDWALPLLFTDVIELDALPVDVRDAMVRQRLAWMRPGDTVYIQADHDLHDVWRRHHMCSPHSHGWVYEQTGPDQWRARVTRRLPVEC
jgi:uncharacterized protein (DUF2249 family)